MSRSLRRFAFILLLGFLGLVGNLSYIHVARSKALSDHSGNRRLLIKEYSIQRGQMIAGGDVLAESVATNDKLKYLRRYPDAGLYSFITGYYSVVFGRTGLEESFNDYLIGEKPATFERNLIDELLGRDVKGNSLVLTIDPTLQRIAQKALGTQRGAVAAVDVKTGAVLALWSYPTYNPDPLSGHDLDVMQKQWDRLNKDASHPLLPRATQERYPPGSTFKPVILAAALEKGMRPTTSFPNPSAGFRLPDTNRVLRNFGGGPCPGGGSVSLENGLRVSCNATFAQAALAAGRKDVVAMAEKFGLDKATDFDLPLTRSCVVADPQGGCSEPLLNRPQVALTGIGQFGVRVTPLQMAVVSATIANGGRVPRPYIVKEVQDFTGNVVETFKPSLSRPIYSEQTAKWMKDLMIKVVERGTGTNARIGGVAVGGKTGTAQTGVENDLPHTWFIAFTPNIAVAVIVEHGGNLGNEATGGRVSAPIARAIMESWESRLKGAKQ